LRTPQCRVARSNPTVVGGNEFVGSLRPVILMLAPAGSLSTDATQAIAALVLKDRGSMSA